MNKTVQAYIGFGMVILGIVLLFVLPIDSKIPGAAASIVGIIVAIEAFISSERSNKQLVKLVKQHDENDKTDHKEIKEQNTKIVKTIEKHVKDTRQDEKIKAMLRRFRYAVNLNKIPLKDMVANFDKPIRTIIIYAFKNATVRKNLLKHSFRYLGGMGVYILPPNKMPDIRDYELTRWVNENILGGLDPSKPEYQIPIAVPVDLRYCFCSQKSLPKSRNWKTVFQVLGIDETFMQDNSVYHFLKESVPLAKVIQRGDINFLLSPYITDENEFYNLATKKKKIESSVMASINQSGKFKLNYWIDASHADLKEILETHLKDADAEDVATKLKQEAEFWSEWLKGE